LGLIALGRETQHIAQQEWWDSLLSAVASCRDLGGLRPSADREESALTRINQAIPDLFASPRAALPARNAVGDRMRQIYHQQGIPLADLEPRHQAGAAP
jgi:hypothetical protein